jgi:protein O-mannosyl-transferase
VAGLVVAVLLAYWPTLDGAFLWDDDAHVTRPELRSLGGLVRIWFDVGATQQYYPLLHSAFWLEHALWGNAVTPYHATTVLLHALAAVLFLLVLRRLEVPGATLAAFLFALHPVHVESVAWISEQKNTLSLVLFLGALLAYLRFDGERRPAPYVLASVLFLLGLLTKTVVATLPAVLLVILWWKRGRLSLRHDVVPLGAWLVAGAAAGLVTATFERRLLGAEGADFALTAVERVLLAGRVVWFYLGKLLWPVHLSFVYPRWTIDASRPWAFVLPAAALAVTAGAWWLRRRARAPLAAWLVFVGCLFPALGFVNVYPFVFSFVADHFQYLPSLAVAAAVGAGATTLATRAVRARPDARPLVSAAALAMVALLGLLTWRRGHVFADPATLYQATLEENPGCYLCLHNLGTLYAQSGRFEEAAEHYRAALALKPDSPEAHDNLGTALVKLGRPAEGIAEYEKAVAAAPRSVKARTDLGIVLFSMGRVAEARAQFEEALRIFPGYAPARQNLSVIESRIGAAASR